MTDLIATLTDEHGILAAGWVLFFGAVGVIFWLYRDLRKSTARHMENYKEVIQANTEAMVALRSRLEDGSRRHE